MPDIIIKSDYAEPKRPKRSRDTEVNTISLLGSDGTVVHRQNDTTPKPAESKPKQSPSSTGQGEEKVVEILDPKAIKQNIVANWQKYQNHPQVIVKLIQRLYQNLGTASSQLSNLKSVLAQLTPTPPAEFLEKLRLSRKDYKTLREAYREKRDKEGKDLCTRTNV